MMSDSEKLISIIIPAYNAEKYLDRCIKSVIAQTYVNWEAIIVDDGSTDSTGLIGKMYANEYEQIRLVSHKSNRGLFQARLSGAKETRGEYIIFLDSDDYISIDYYRLMVNKAIGSNYDMVLGDFCLKFEESNQICFYNYDPIRCQEIELYNDLGIDMFMKQEGSFYGWHVIWNKLISKSLWNKCVSDYDLFSNDAGKIVMTEDVAFSCVLWMNACKIGNVHNAYYFYCQHSGCSRDSKSYEDIEKEIGNVIFVFGFFKDMLIKKKLWDKYEKNYINWKNYYGRIYVNKAINIKCTRSEIEHIGKNFELSKIEGTSESDNFFYQYVTDLHPSFFWYEDIKKHIIDEKYKLISFDIFDTLIVRPFWKPDDLYYLLDEDFNAVMGNNTYINFHKVRVEAEKNCREKNELVQKEEITIEEIYKEISNLCHLDKNNLNDLCLKEIDLEERYCFVRRSGKELYTLAKYYKKDIIFCSDMYLPEKAILEILHKNGYIGTLYLSSSVGLTKESGNLFKYIISNERINRNRIIHIGDDWHRDHEQPISCGIKAFHLSSPVALIQNINPGICTGSAYKNIFTNNIESFDLCIGFNSYIGMRCLLAVVANRFFDYPVCSFNCKSDFNGDAYYIGYFLVGWHLLAISKWICRSIRGTSKTIHFVSRDGYLVQKFFEEFQSEPKIKTNYLTVSRKSLLLADIKKYNDLLSLISKLDIENLSPKALLNYLEPLFQADFETIINREKKNTRYDINFLCFKDFQNYLDHLYRDYTNMFNFDSYRNVIKQYFENIIDENDWIFDIGYSGRTEFTLSKLLGINLNSLYVHANSDILQYRINNLKNHNYCFYDSKPKITGNIREHIFMAHSPSVISYRQCASGVIMPVYEEVDENYKDKLISSIVHNGALDFIVEVKKIFGPDFNKLYMRENDLSAPYEYYMNFAKKIDRNIWKTVFFEDDLLFGKKYRLVDIWGDDINKRVDLIQKFKFEDVILWDNEKYKESSFSLSDYVKEIKDIEFEIDHSRQQDLKTQAEQYLFEINSIRSSKSYKIGLAITYLPRKIRSLIHRGVKIWRKN